MQHFLRFAFSTSLLVASLASGCGPDSPEGDASNTVEQEGSVRMAFLAFEDQERPWEPLSVWVHTQYTPFYGRDCVQAADGTHWCIVDEVRVPAGPREDAFPSSRDAVCAEHTGTGWNCVAVVPEEQRWAIGFSVPCFRSLCERRYLVATGTESRPGERPDPDQWMEVRVNFVDLAPVAESGMRPPRVNPAEVTDFVPVETAWPALIIDRRQAVARIGTVPAVTWWTPSRDGDQPRQLEVVCLDDAGTICVEVDPPNRH
jgi:hypothetical protein